ncbi:hypothetical protein T439DRAFT_48619 [Meredithblackwellia eburnea MCA 4105]
MSEDLRHLIKSNPDGFNHMTPTSRWLPKDFCPLVHHSRLLRVHPIPSEWVPMRGDARCCLLIEAKDTKEILLFRHGIHQDYYLPCVDPFHLLDLEEGPMEVIEQLADIAFKNSTGIGLYSRGSPSFESVDVLYGPDGPDGSDDRGIRTVIALNLVFETKSDLLLPKVSCFEYSFPPGTDFLLSYLGFLPQHHNNENGLIRYTWQQPENLCHISHLLNQDLRIICEDWMR